MENSRHETSGSPAMAVLICGLVAGGGLFVAMSYGTTPSRDLGQMSAVKGPHAAAATPNSTAPPPKNFAGRELLFEQFYYQELPGAVFDDCNLHGALFDETHLIDASFRRAQLTDVQMWNGSVEGADFTDAVVNGLQLESGVESATEQLSPAQFKSTWSYKTGTLRRCRIPGASHAYLEPPNYDFRRKNLQHASLKFDHRSTQLDGADVQFAKLNCKLRFEQLKSTETFRGGAFQQMWLGPLEGQADFTRIAFIDTWLFLQGNEILDDADFSGRTYVFGPLTFEQLRTTRNYRRGTVLGLAFNGANFREADFRGVNLGGSNFHTCRFDGADFRDAIISGCRFSLFSADEGGLTLEQIRSTWNYRNGRMAGIMLPPKLTAALEVPEGNSDQEKPPGSAAKSSP